MVRRLKDLRFAGLGKQQPITMAQRGSGANATPRTPAKPAQAAAAAKTSGRARNEGGRDGQTGTTPGCDDRA